MQDTYTLEATFRIVTPLFLGGANPTDRAELRPPSIKGALRFWYRAIAPDYRIHEGTLFGGTGKGEGQAMFFVSVSDIRRKEGQRNDDRWDGTPIAYLGYGVIVRDKVKKKSLTTRPYLDVGTLFTRSLRFKPCLQPEDKLRVTKALWALSMLGGLGARSRRGFGSMAMLADGNGSGPRSMDGLPSVTPRDEKELVAALKSFFEELPRPGGLREYTSWGHDARCVVVPRNSDALRTLDWLGREMHDCRSYRGSKTNRWVTADHDLMHDFIGKSKTPSTPPLRAAFGLPHNYFFT
jgi:CRISPR-associated protein Cmr1